ncbi:phage tail protein [Longimycelium tulufanense]|uniref:phage tail protein n=1 Tax=Longimycelium tulufanense TaxID=907463 RepID=UPI001665AF8C|nr:hypothetical protein [Longimycelium tulufanense]
MRRNLVSLRRLFSVNPRTLFVDQLVSGLRRSAQRARQLVAQVRTSATESRRFVRSTIRVRAHWERLRCAAEGVSTVLARIHARGLVTANRAAIETTRQVQRLRTAVLGLPAVFARLRAQGLLGTARHGVDGLARGLRRTAGAARALGGQLRDSDSAVRRLLRSTVSLRGHWERMRAAASGLSSALTPVRGGGLFRVAQRGLTDVAKGALGATRGVERFAHAAVAAPLGIFRKTLGLTTKAFGGFVKGAFNAVRGLARLSHGALIAIAVLALMSPVVALVAGLLAGIPALATAGGAALAAIVLGLDGIKQAAGVLKPSVDGLKKSLSETFESGLTPVFRQLNTVMPTVTTGLNHVAKGLIPLAQAFTDVVTSASGMEQLGLLLENTGKFVSDLSPMVRDFTAAFLTLAAEGSKQFGLLAGVLNGFAAQWREMVDRIVANGAFAKAIEGLSQLTSGFLSSFTKLFEAGMVAMGQLGATMGNFLNDFADGAVALMPILTALSKLLFEVVGAALRVLIPSLEALQPSLTELGRVLGQVLVGALTSLEPILTALAKILGELILAALRALEPILGPLVDFFTQLGVILADFLLQAFAELRPLLEQIAQFFVQLFEAVQPLLPQLLDLAKLIFDQAIRALQQVMPPVLELAEKAFPALIGIVEQLAPHLGEIIRLAAGLIPPLVNLGLKILEICIPVMQGFLDVVKAVWPDIQQIIMGALEVIKGILVLAMAIVTGDWEKAWSGMKRIFSGAWEMIKGAAKAGLHGLVTFVSEIPGKLLAALGDLGGLLLDAGKALIGGLIEGVKSMINKAKNAAKSVVQAIRNFFPFSPARTGPFSGRGYTSYSGRALVEDWAAGIESRTPKAIQAVEDMMAATNTAATAEWQGHITAENFGFLGDRIAEALAGWTVQIDGDGLARMVNKHNALRARRR